MYRLRNNTFLSQRRTFSGELTSINIWLQWSQEWPFVARTSNAFDVPHFAR